MKYKKIEVIAHLSLGEIASLSISLGDWGEGNEYSFFKSFV